MFKAANNTIIGLNQDGFSELFARQNHAKTQRSAICFISKCCQIIYRNMLQSIGGLWRDTRRSMEPQREERSTIIRWITPTCLLDWYSDGNECVYKSIVCINQFLALVYKSIFSSLYKIIKFWIKKVNVVKITLNKEKEYYNHKIIINIIWLHQSYIKKNDNELSDCCYQVQDKSEDDIHALLIYLFISFWKNEWMNEVCLKVLNEWLGCLHHPIWSLADGDNMQPEAFSPFEGE